MNRISKAFAENKKVFIASLTAGDPNLEATKNLIAAMEEAGAGIIELGIPFSDPVAEGEAMQRADERALAAGTTTDKIFDLVAEVRQTTQIPVVLVTYINPIYTYGCEKFFTRCEESGVDGVLVPDLPYEEREELLPYSEPHKIISIPIIAHTSKDRVKMIAAKAEGYVYAVGYMGTDGASERINGIVANIVAETKKVKDIPVAVGHRVRSVEQARDMGKVSDGIIVDCAIAEIVEKYGEDAAEHVAEYVRKMIAAMNA